MGGPESGATEPAPGTSGLPAGPGLAEIRIIGTAHVSKVSVEEVRAAVLEWKPDLIAVELDPGRYRALKQQAAEANVSDVIEGGNFTQLLVQWILAYLQRKIGMDMGVEPGAELKAAIEEAESRGLPLALIDRDIRITLHRFWKSLRTLEKLRLVYALTISVVKMDAGEQIDVEALKKQDMIEMAMEEFRSFSPNGARALIDERDAYLAHQLLGLRPGRGRILAVMGAGHVRGVQAYLDNPAALPPPGELTKEIKSLPWGKIFEVVVIALFAYLLAAIAFSGVGWTVLLWALVYWVLIHGLFTAVFTLAAGGHPLSALTGFAVSWATALHPLIAAGWFSAIMEAKIRKPGPADLKRIFQAETFTEMWKVPLFRVVMVAALANVGSTIGTVLYFIFIFPFLGIDPVVLISTGTTNMWNAITGLFSGL